MPLIKGDARKDCCKQEANLGQKQQVDGRKDLSFRRCGVCGCRHFEMMADPLRMNVRGGRVGG
jgi:hypothetical protein